MQVRIPLNTVMLTTHELLKLSVWTNVTLTMNFKAGVHLVFHQPVLSSWIILIFKINNGKFLTLIYEKWKTFHRKNEISIKIDSVFRKILVNNLSMANKMCIFYSQYFRIYFHRMNRNIFIQTNRSTMPWIFSTQLRADLNSWWDGSKREFQWNSTFLFAF